MTQAKNPERFIYQNVRAFANGWFKTGDLGRVDTDGHFSIVGRLKDMIISGGANIYPAEIERAIEAHPAVAGAAVIGVPDPKWGEVGKAIIELQPGKALTLEDLTNFLGQNLGKFKLPKYGALKLYMLLIKAKCNKWLHVKTK